MSVLPSPAPRLVNTENWMTIAKCDKQKWEAFVLGGLEHFEVNWREERNAKGYGRKITKANLIETPCYPFLKNN